VQDNTPYNEDGIVKLAFTDQGNKLVTISRNGRIVVRAANTGDIVKNSWSVNSENLNSSVFDSSGQYLAQHAKNGNNIEISDILQTRKKTSTFTNNEEVLSLAFSPDSNYLAAGLNNNTIKIWEIKGGISTLNTQAPVTSLAFSADNRYIIAFEHATNFNEISIFDIKEKTRIDTLKTNESITSIECSPVNSLIFATTTVNKETDTRTIKIFKIISPKMFSNNELFWKLFSILTDSNNAKKISTDKKIQELSTLAIHDKPTMNKYPEKF